jgi:hypothetical protein
MAKKKRSVFDRIREILAELDQLLAPQPKPAPVPVPVRVRKDRR